MKKLNSETLDAIITIIGTLEAEPQKTISNLGCGCFARHFGDNNKYSKVILPGDTFEDAKLQLHYILFDLGVDCGLSESQLKALDNI